MLNAARYFCFLKGYTGAVFPAFSTSKCVVGLVCDWRLTDFDDISATFMRDRSFLEKGILRRREVPL